MSWTSLDVHSSIQDLYQIILLLMYPAWWDCETADMYGAKQKLGTTDLMI